MRGWGRAACGILLVLFCTAVVSGQVTATGTQVVFSVVDENGLAVSGARVTVIETGSAPVTRWTDYAGRCEYRLLRMAPYQLRVAKPGYYEASEDKIDPHQEHVVATLTYEQMVQQQVNVTASIPGIDTQEISHQSTMNTPEIVSVPYPTSRDIRNLLPFNPGVVADSTGQVHVAGSETWGTLDTLDGFDIRSPVSGLLAMRVSTDAVRSMSVQTTRYPVEFGRSTGGVIAFTTGMGDNKFHFNMTDFLPSFRQQNGIRFDKVVPRVTFSGPIARNRAWFFDGVEAEYDNIYIPELPAGADTNHLLRGSNLIKVQVNAGSNKLTAGLLFNDFHSPYDGISPLVPQASTVKRDTIAWLPYLHDQRILHNGALFDVGIGVVRIRDGYEPHGDTSYEITPEMSEGSYFESQTGRSQRVEGTATLFLPPQEWAGRHDIKAGIDADHIGFDDTVARAPVNYLREDGTLLRQSVFPATPPFTLHNVEVGAYVEDRWTPRKGWLSNMLVEPGLRFDWDEIIRRPLFSPRLGVVYAPRGAETKTKVSAGIGIYYEHTQLEYLAEAFAGVRFDTYYEADGLTPAGPPLQTTFSYNQSTLLEARALNWSVGLEQKLPGSIYADVNFLDKRIINSFTYANQNGPAALSGPYLLTNARQDHDSLEEVGMRRTFSGGYTIFAAYTHSSAHTNAAINYVPTVSLLGPQQSGPLPWNTPNRAISWGWLPVALPRFKKSWDFVYTLDWRSGFPITSVNANQQVIGAVGSERFPDYLSFSPGLEWRFHFHGYYFGLRGIVENITNRQNPSVVNNNVDSPDYLMFTEPLGRAFTTRIRLIGSK